jgi:hypothetical protein
LLFLVLPLAPILFDFFWGGHAPKFVEALRLQDGIDGAAGCPDQ